MAAASHNASFNLYLLGCVRIKPQTNIRKPGNTPLRSPRKPQLGREAARHGAVQVLVFTHQAGAKAMGFSLRYFESSLVSTGSFRKATVCHCELLAVQLEPGRGSVATESAADATCEKCSETREKLMHLLILPFFGWFSNEEGMKVRHRHAGLGLFCIQH